MIEQDCDFSCPYCGAENSVRLDVTGGRKQSFVQDCVVCCKPIELLAQFDKGELVNFSAEQQE